jgi:RNA-binding protein Nova
MMFCFVFGGVDPDAVYLKFMVPQATAGSVIGKGGQNISDLQKEFSVHIRMSKANDTFPGTLKKWVV